MGAVTPGTAERPAHLSTLLDALLLYEEVWALEAQLSSDAEKLTMRQVLFDRRACSRRRRSTVAIRPGSKPCAARTDGTWSFTAVTAGSRACLR
ncbi:hypothetical protein TN53_27245 [Streptomyces sp. WM6386]|nr:hypothetical protein TN53_27245 [Streptomyces sp. WM6386]